MRNFPLDPWATKLWEWQQTSGFWPIGPYEYDRMEPRVIAGPDSYMASACDLVTGPIRLNVQDARDDLASLMFDLEPYAGTTALPLMAIHLFRAISQ